MSSIYAVITGDVINSGELDTDYQPELKEVFRLFTSHFGNVLPLDVDQYRGDQFQILIDHPPRSLQATLFISSLLASWNPRILVRLSLGIGEVQSLPEERVSMGDGEAFRLSGTNLDKMEDHQRILIASTTEVNPLLEGSSDLLSSIIVDWSQQQAEAVYYKIKGWTNSDIANELDISKPSVGDRLEAAEWKYLNSFASSFSDYWNSKG